MLNRIIIVLLVGCIFFPNYGNAQSKIVTESIDSVKIKYDLSDDTTEKLPISVSCAYYKFTPMDTMVYSVHSMDSVVIDFGTPLLKNRQEVLQVICDSVGKANNHYYLQLELVAYRVDEGEMNSEKITHSNSEWLNRKVYLELDSVGHRYAVSYDDSTMLGSAPGGAFQPYMFFGFAEACHEVGRSWNLISSQDYIVENGLPCPVLRSSYLFTNRGYTDTLGYKTNKLDFVKTGQGSITFSEGKGQVRVTNILASGGSINIGLEPRVPVHFYQTMEQKLVIHSPNGVEKPGRHYISSFFTLVEYNKYVDPANENKKSRKKNKNKKK